MTVRVGVVGSGFMGRTWSEVAANHATGTTLSRRDRREARDGARGRLRHTARAGPRRAAGAGRRRRRGPGHAAGRPSGPDARRRPRPDGTSSSRSRWPSRPPSAPRWSAACRAAGVRLSVVSQHRFRDAPVAAKRLIDEGAIGDVRMIQVTGAEVGWWDLAGPRRRMEARSAPADRLGLMGRP